MSSIAIQRHNHSLEPFCTSDLKERSEVQNDTILESGPDRSKSQAGLIAESMFNNSGGFRGNPRNGNDGNNNFQMQFPLPSNGSNNNSTIAGTSSLSNPYRNLANSDFLMRSQLLQQHSQHQHQQQRLLQMTKNDFEVQQMANNITETLMIKRRLASIQQLQEQEKMRAELQMQVAQRASVNSIRSHNNKSLMGRNSMSSITNTSVVPHKQREDEMTKPDLSTLAETAVAVASASTGVNSRVRSNSHNGASTITKSTNTATSDRIAALLRKPPASSGSVKNLVGLGSSVSSTNNATMEALRREMNASHHKLQTDNNFKRSLDDMMKGNTATSPSWLWNTSPTGSGFEGNQKSMIDRLRAQHQQLLLQRRNSLPATSSTPSPSSEFSSPRTMKKQRIFEPNFGITDAMEQMRQLDSSLKMKMKMSKNSALLAQIMASPSNRRSSIASSVASGATSATAPNLSTHHANVRRKNSMSAESPMSSETLNKLNQMGGGFPMPKFLQRSGADVSMGTTSSAAGETEVNIPAEITPDTNKDVVDVSCSDTSSPSRRQRGHHSQQKDQLRYLERIGGFPMPPLFRQGKNNSNDSSNDVVQDRSRHEESGAVKDSYSPSTTTISSHIKNATNRCANEGKASRPPALDSYKQIWRDIRVVAGDDPEVDERLRKEVFARKLQRGEILVGKRNDRFAAAKTFEKNEKSESGKGGSPGQSGGGSEKTVVI